jgi:DNA-binding MarR family transcriptional regulator
MKNREMGQQALPRLPCACAVFRRASRAMTRVYERHLRGSGLNVAQFTLMQALAHVEPITQGRLGHLLALDSTTLSRTLRPLEAKRWLRSESGTDRRERRLGLTEAGRSQLERTTPAWARAQKALKTRLGEERWERLLGELSMLAGVVGEI